MKLENLAIPSTIDYFQSQSGSMLTLLENLVMQDTPASSKANLDQMVRQLANELATSGGNIEVLPMEVKGNCLRATWTGSNHDKEQILILCHIDTVWPLGEAARRPFTIKNGLAYGPGVLDMKAGVVELVFALRGLLTLGFTPSRNVTALITCDEEVGSASSRDLIETEACASKATLVLEPAMPDGALKTARKGWGLFNITVHGRSAHAGANPEAGVSAIEEIAHQTIYLHSLTNHNVGTTVNVGVIRGGTRPNVIAALAEADVDLRVKTLAEAERILPAIMNLKPILSDCSMEVIGGLNRPPMERTDGNVMLFTRVQQLSKSLGFNVGEALSGAASDGNFSTVLGIPTLDGLGAVGGGPHAEDEYIEIDSLAQRTALLACILTDPDLLEKS